MSIGSLAFDGAFTVQVFVVNLRRPQDRAALGQPGGWQVSAGDHVWLSKNVGGTYDIRMAHVGWVSWFACV